MYLLSLNRGSYRSVVDQNHSDISRDKHRRAKEILDSITRHSRI
jgi:hypothetical protein